MNESPRDAAEAAVLGAVLMAEPVIDTLVGEGLKPDHFRRTQYAAVYTGMLALKDAGEPIDALTLRARFAGPMSPVTEADIEFLAVSVPNLANVRGYCQIIRDESWFDNARGALHSAENAIAERDRDRLIREITRIVDLDDNPDESDPATEFLAWYDHEQSGWPFPWGVLTESVGGGLLPGETTVLGGWSGMGKTFLLAQMLRCCRKAGATVHEYANEMHGPKRTSRTVTAMTGIPSQLIDKRRLTDQQRRDVIAALKSLPYSTTGTAGWTVEQYCRDIRRRKWDVAAIDTVTNLPCSRVDEWDRACVMLADAAAQANTHLVLVSQLNLERDKGKKPPPVGRDLRNTGAWYQRARVVMFVHRDQEKIEAGDGAEIWRAVSDGHVRVEKASHGDASTGYLDVTFNSRWLRFDALDDYRRPLEGVA